MKHRFGVSTLLYRNQRLTRDHLNEIAAHGFETVEVAHHPIVVSDLLAWLADARLDLHGLHPPAGASADDLDAALFVARQIPMRVLTLQVARVKEAARDIDRLLELAQPLNVTIAVDSNSDALSPASSLVHFVEGFESPVGISLDFAKARRDGDLMDAIETVSEHLISTHIPLENRIDWASALTTVQKVGYEGPFIFDLAPRGSSKEQLALARKQRERMESLL